MNDTDEMYQPPFQPTSWAGLIWFWGLPAGILGVFLAMFTGAIPSPITDAARQAHANYEILTARNHLFEEVLYLDLNACIHTARNRTEEQLCLNAANQACQDLDKVREEMERAKGAK